MCVKCLFNNKGVVSTVISMLYIEGKLMYKIMVETGDKGMQDKNARGHIVFVGEKQESGKSFKKTNW